MKSSKKIKKILKVKKVVEKKPRKDPRIQRIYEEIVEFDCPVRGRVKQKVKIKRFKTLNEQTKQLMASSDDIDKLEDSDDGLAIYNDGEALGLSDKPPEE